MKKLILLFCLILATNISFSQDYKTAVGVRGGWDGSLSLKHFISENGAIEVVPAVFIFNPGLALTVYYEHHGDLGVDDLKWYFGGGINGGTYFSTPRFLNPDLNLPNFNFFGISTILGLEYRFEGYPFTVSADIAPRLRFLGFRSLALGTGGNVAVRYIINDNEGS